VYVLGIPFFCFYLLKAAVRTNSLEHPVFKQRFGSLYLRYERKFWWWEMVVMLRRLVALAVLVLASRYELLQCAMMLVVFFFAVVVQDNARPYHSDMVDNFEFLQLLTCHFVLLAGMCYDGMSKTLLTTNTCDSTNGTVISVECTHEATKRTFTTMNQFVASAAILCVVAGSFACGGATVWAQVHSVVKALFKVEEHEVGPSHKMTHLLDLAERVMAADVLPATKEWLLDASTPSEREYFKHLLMLLDQNYEDYMALQSKHFSDFLERSQEQLVDNMRFLLKFLSTVLQIICCLRVRKKKVNQFNAQGQQGAPGDAPKPKKRRMPFGKRAPAETSKVKTEVPSGLRRVDQEDDDLVEAYLRSRAEQQQKARPRRVPPRPRRVTHRPLAAGGCRRWRVLPADDDTELRGCVTGVVTS